MAFRHLTLTAAALSTAILSTTAPITGFAQTYPLKPIRMIAEFGAGSGGDLVLRAIQSPIGDALGQAIIIENRPGAGGVVAADQVSKASPDGYVIGASTPNGLVSRRFLAKGGAPVDVLKDLTPLSAVGETVTLVLASLSAPVKTLKEMIDYGKANPDKLSYGTSGFGTTHHLSQEQVRMITGASLLHVPYKTGVAAVQGLLTGEIPIAYSILGSIGPHLRSGKVIPIARVGSQRYPPLPDVPALAELAPGFQAPPSWTGLFAPPNLPPAILARLGGDIVKALNLPATKAKLLEVGFEVIGNTPAEFSALIRTQIELTGKIVKAANIQPIE
ncbi:MAG: tripartite tricarboxylate transporter substrate binding protein [Betaproteobacteria bacterium]|nr:tripartite tricarboxylate transporter substrate binding protein [Betaproteobacteria bacterium]